MSMSWGWYLSFLLSFVQYSLVLIILKFFHVCNYFFNAIGVECRLHTADRNNVHRRLLRVNNG